MSARSRTLAGLVAAVTATTTLAACGGSDEAATPTGSASPTVTTSAAPTPTTSTSEPSSSSSGAVGSSGSASGTTAPDSSASSSPATSATATRTGTQATTGTPVRLTMPSLGFDQPVRAMGLNNGAIDPPPHVVQWYTGSVRPGSPGISVIAGHVAPHGGRPGIFSSLPRMSVGDTVDLAYAGGGTRTFRVYAKEAVGKKALQSDARVWGTSSTPVVALITCDADAEHVGGHSTKNYVVWVKPA